MFFPLQILPGFHVSLRSRSPPLIFLDGQLVLDEKPCRRNTRPFRSIPRSHTFTCRIYRRFVSLINPCTCTFISGACPCATKASGNCLPTMRHTGTISSASWAGPLAPTKHCSVQVCNFICHSFPPLCSLEARPEKDHAAQIRMMAMLLARYPEHRQSMRLFLVGGVRDERDATRVDELKELADSLQVSVGCRPKNRIP